MPQAAAPTLARNMSMVRIANKKSVAFRANHVFRRHAAIFEFNFSDRMCRDHRRAFDHAEARHLCADDKRRQRSAAIRFGAGSRKHGVEIGHAGVRNKTLAAVDHVGIAVAPRSSFDSGNIGSGVGFG